VEGEILSCIYRVYRAGGIKMDEKIIRKSFEKAVKDLEEQIQPINDNEYIDYLIQKIWLGLPIHIRMPSMVDMITEMVNEKIMKAKDDYFKTIGLIEDDEGPKRDEYMIEINITDPGTVFHVSGAGPDYLDIVSTLEEAVGSIIFHNKQTTLSPPKNDFNLVMEIYDENAPDEDDKNIFGRDEKHLTTNEIIDILHEARVFMYHYK